jgi:CelD/BcsL family acetyltransferase involved in cellulose biosynthesis
MEDAESITRNSYMRGLGRGFSQGETIRRRVELEMRRGLLRGYFLHIDDRPCSYWITSVYDGVSYSGWMGYDPDYREYSVGMFLVIKAIDGLVASGVRFVDFDSGDFLWKELLGNESWEEASIRIFAPTLKGYVANAMRTLGIAGVLPVKALLRRDLLWRIQRWRGYRAAKVDSRAIESS